MTNAPIPVDGVSADVVEEAAGRAHAAWLAARGRRVDQQSLGYERDDDRPVVPRGDLPEHEGDVARAVVRAVLDTLADAGVETVVRLLWPPWPDSDQTGDLVLYQGDRVDVCVRRDPGAGIEGYVYTRWYGGRAVVAVLPFRLLRGWGWEVLLTDEVVPAWQGTGLSVVTGTPESDDPAIDAVRELAEETGYEAAADELISLGDVYASKGSSSRYEMYAVDVTGREPGVATGDGSPIESAASTTWVHVNDLWKVRHSLVHTMTDRLAQRWASERSA